MRFMRRSAALLLCAVVLGSSLTFASCDRGNTPNENSKPVVTAYAPTVPANPIDPSVKGETTEAAIGDTVNYQKKISVTLDKVVEIDTAGGTGGRVLCIEMTIANHGDNTLDCNTLTHFIGAKEGKDDDAMTRSTTASIFARKYYTKTGSDLQSFNSPIKPGETLKGYIYMLAPASWKELSIAYIPYKYYSNDKVLFTIEESKLTHYTESFD